jgi:predicted nuclease of predicted toxin-antitoxin system
MPLALYLDDCAASKRLAELLRGAGHTVVVPADIGLTGVDDDVHFAHARSQDRIVVTKNPADFIALHSDSSEHPGMFLIYQDNDPARDVSDQEIVLAIANLEATFGQTPLSNQFHVLNQWRVRADPTPPPLSSPPPADQDEGEGKKKGRQGNQKRKK